ncbi:MAG: sulfotransferase domain-containing protein [Cyclobacteriaceae bacterium]
MDISAIFNNVKLKTIKEINNSLTFVWGEQLHTSYVVEFPKCGGTWVSELVRTYLRIDKKYGTSNFVKKNAVIQRHTLPKSYINKAIVVIRDPKDMLVSFFFYEVFRNRIINAKLLELIDYEEGQDEKVLFKKYCLEKVLRPNRTFPNFSYSDFINQWERFENTHFVSYEQLHANTTKELEHMLEFLGCIIDNKRVVETVEKCSFKNASGGRNLGEEQKSAFRRKGIVGDWKNYFDDELLGLVEKEISSKINNEISKRFVAD